MSEDKPKLPSKVTIYIPKSVRAAYHERVSRSDRSASEIHMDALFGNGKYDPELKEVGAKLIAEAAAIKTEVKSKDLMSEDIARELKLIRTVGMAMMGRRS